MLTDFIARRYATAVRGICCRRVYVGLPFCLPITSRYCAKTARLLLRITKTTPIDNSFLVRKISATLQYGPTAEAPNHTGVVGQTSLSVTGLL